MTRSGAVLEISEGSKIVHPEEVEPQHERFSGNLSPEPVIRFRTLSVTVNGLQDVPIFLEVERSRLLRAAIFGDGSGRPIFERIPDSEPPQGGVSMEFACIGGPQAPDVVLFVVDLSNFLNEVSCERFGY